MTLSLKPALSKLAEIYSKSIFMKRLGIGALVQSRQSTRLVSGGL